MRVNKCLYLILFMLSGQAISATTVTVADNEFQKIHLANSTYNRIAIKNNRILSIKGENGNYDLQTDEQTGDVYLKPLIAKQFNLFVTSESLEHYQLEVYPDLNITQTVLLKPKNKANSMHNTPKDSSSYVEKVASLMKLMYSKKQNKFYETVFLNEKQTTNQSDFKVNKIAVYNGHDLTGEVLLVKNIQKQAKEIIPSKFAEPGVVAVATNATILEHNISAIVYRILSND